MTQHAWILEFPYFASLSSGRLDALRGEAPAGQRVLVHCSAGLNRSVTICCAALILLEGLSAEAALDRIFEHHPWARPDSHHWLILRWIAQQKMEQQRND